MDGRIKRIAGLSRRTCEAGVIAALVVGSAVPFAARATETVFYAQGRAHPLGSSSSQVHVQLSSSADPSEVSDALVQAGFAALEPIDGITAFLPIHRLPINGLTNDEKGSILAISGIEVVRPVYSPAQSDATMVLTDEMIVRCDAGAVAAIAADFNLGVVRQFEWLGPDAALGRVGDVYVMRLLDEADTDAARTAAALNNDPRVVYSHPNALGLVEPHQAQINDPLVPLQWHLDNRGDLGGRAGVDVNAIEAWELSQGEGVLVAVLDSGFDIGHEDLAENYSGIGLDPFGGSNVPALAAHGTAVTGLICAAGNQFGGRGVAPKAKFIAVSLLGGPTSLTEIVLSFQFAVTSGADIINNSWGTVIGFPVPDLEVEAIQDAASRGRGGRGTLVLFSAGNDGTFISALRDEAAIFGVMAVGALLRDGSPTCYTNFGIEQSVSAPGGGVNFIADCFTADMITTDITGDLGFNGGGFPGNPNELPDRNYTNAFNGTSAASPVVAGVAALVLQVNSELTGAQLRNLLEHTATKDDVFRADFDSVTGHNVRHGHGRVDALAAVKAAQRGWLWPDTVRDVVAVVGSDLVNLSWDNPGNDVQFEALVVRSAGKLEWAPKDLETYEIGDLPASGVRIVEKAAVSRFTERIPFDGPAEFGIFIRNGQGRYSWGRRAAVVSTPVEGAGTLRVTATAQPTLGKAPLTVEFFGGADADTDAVSFEWRLGDELRNEAGGLIRAEAIRFGRFVTHTYTESGAFQARLIVTDSEGNTGSATVLVRVEVANQAPIVDISAEPITGFAPLAVTFTAGGSDPDGRIRRFFWDFGDDETAEGHMADHIYESPGVFAVTLTALDDSGGTSLATVEIVVNGADGTSGTEVSGVNTAGQGAPTSPLLPGFCGSLGIEALALTVMGLFAVGLSIRRRRD